MSAADLSAIASHVAAEPTDEVRWLVLADWLDERGDGRGAKVRRWWRVRPALVRAWGWWETAGVGTLNLSAAACVGLGDDWWRLAATLNLRLCRDRWPVPYDRITTWPAGWSSGRHQSVLADSVVQVELAALGLADLSAAGASAGAAAVASAGASAGAAAGAAAVSAAVAAARAARAARAAVWASESAEFAARAVAWSARPAVSAAESAEAAMASRSRRSRRGWRGRRGRRGWRRPACTSGPLTCCGRSRMDRNYHVYTVGRQGHRRLVAVVRATSQALAEARAAECYRTTEPGERLVVAPEGWSHVRW